MKKVLPWVITCIYLIVYVWLMKTLSLWGLEYIVVFSFFAFVPLYTISCSFSRYLNVFQQQETRYNGISFKSYYWYLLGQCSQKLSDKDIHEW